MDQQLLQRLQDISYAITDLRDSQAHHTAIIHETHTKLEKLENFLKAMPGSTYGIPGWQHLMPGNARETVTLTGPNTLWSSVDARSNLIGFRDMTKLLKFEENGIPVPYINYPINQKETMFRFRTEADADVFVKEWEKLQDSWSELIATQGARQG